MVCMYVCMFRGGFPHALGPLCGLLYVPCEFSKQPPYPLAVMAPLAPPTRERRNHHPSGGIDEYVL
jgi:hypothetical protein